MTLILGVDPGKTTGWCVYDTEARRVAEAGTFPGFDVPREMWSHDALNIRADVVVIEQPMPYGFTRPDVVTTSWIAGVLYGDLTFLERPQTLTRLDVKQILSEATLREIVVKDDKTAWQALLLLHGGDEAGKKPSKKHPGGAIGIATSHARAALAVAVAWSIRNASTA